MKFTKIRLLLFLTADRAGFASFITASKPRFGCCLKLSMKSEHNDSNSNDVSIPACGSTEKAVPCLKPEQRYDADEVDKHVISKQNKKKQNFFARRRNPNLRARFATYDDQKNWELAAPPNYFTNNNLSLVCSEGVYGSKKCSMLSPLNVKSNILDFWGEGRTTGNGVVTGFTNSYNVNYQFQLVSPGADDADRKIPNRIPTQSHENSDIQLYVESDTFKFVTLMASPINKKTAKEMIRVVRKDDGMIILYGQLDKNSTKCFEDEANGCHFFYDRFTSALVTSIEGLENIVTCGHPQFTRVYHKTRSITQYTTNCTFHVREEQGKGDNAHSSFISSEGKVLLGQTLEGDENCTLYKTGSVVFDNGIVSAMASTRLDNSGWVPVNCKSGKGTNKKDYSQFICPKGSVLMGRKLSGDDECYRYGWITCCGMSCETYNVSDWISARSTFTAPNGSVLVGCKYFEGDVETRETWYKVARVRLVVGSNQYT